MDNKYTSLLEGLSKLYSNTEVPVKVRVVHKWQDEAANAVKYFVDSYKHIGSIFKCYKENNHLARVAFSDCKELNKKSCLYFFKVYNILKNK